MSTAPNFPELVARLRRRQRAALRQYEADVAAAERAHARPEDWADRAHARETAELAYYAELAAAWDAYVTERSHRR